MPPCKPTGARRAELGIDLGGIWKRTRGVLTFQMGAPEMQELDVGGPLLFSAVLGLSHLLVRAVCRYRVPSLTPDHTLNRP